MSELEDRKDRGEDPVGETAEAAAKPDPFASLNKLLSENPEFKSVFDSVMHILGEDDGGKEEVEVECVEIDGHTYTIEQTVEVGGHTYWYLVNEEDIMDFLIQRVLVEDGKEYAIDLDSEEEFDLVYAYIQRQNLQMLKEMLRNGGADKPECP